MRRENWPVCLEQILHIHQSQPYQWGRFDCMTLVAHCICAMTGRDYLHNVQAYSNAHGAVRALAGLGFNSSMDFFSAHFERVPASLLRRGDLGFVCGGGCGLSARLGAPFVVLGAHAVNRDHIGWQSVSLQGLDLGFRVE